MDIIRQTLQSLVLGEPQTVRNLTLFPLLGREPRQPDYLTLEEALERKSAKVTEVSEQGQVPQLLVLNGGDRPVLLLDGAELRGEKQNRVLNLTILVPPVSRTEIPVSCVEAGRWAWRRGVGRGRVTSSEHLLYAALRAAKMRQVSTSLSRGWSPASDQGAVWAALEEKFRRMRTPSPTRAMSDLFDSSEDALKELAAGFHALDGQVGILATIRRRPVGVDLFDSERTLGHYLGRLVRSYGMDALEEDPEVAVPHPSLPQAFLQRIASCEMPCYRSVGMGETVRLSGEEIAGGALVVDGRVVHLSAFPVEPPEAHSRIDDEEEDGLDDEDLLRDDEGLRGRTK